MRDSILKYILVISLLMNFSLLGTAGYTYYKNARCSGPFAGPAGFPARPGPPGADVPVGRLAQHLSLKPEQAKVFQEKMAVFYQDLNRKRPEVDRLRESLIALMRADKPDDKAIVATIGRINDIQEGMQKTAVSHILEFKPMLDKDQQSKFLDLIQGAMGRRTEALCP